MLPFRLALPISIHAPAKGATQKVWYPLRKKLYFNPRSREGSDIDGESVPVITGISIHAPAKGATGKLHPLWHRRKFQSTLPRRERLNQHHWLLADLAFQSTLPRRERRRTDGSRRPRMYFNPRSREGSDAICTSSCIVIKNFNPRSREGSDVSGFAVTVLLFISIHAPAKGATTALYLLLVRRQFQSTLPRRERLSAVYTALDHLLFQSTLPRRERRYTDYKLCRGYNFNPRSREGSDAFFSNSWLSIQISIHAPAKGATEDMGVSLERAGISIHAPAKGATATEALDTGQGGISIHAPAKGATRHDAP